MYTGNGVTKKFPLPAGKDGSVVVLKFPSGKGIQLSEGESYTVSNGAVYFFAAVPSGIEISFDELTTQEKINTPTSYVLIYGDGTMREFFEDPAVMIEDAKKLLDDTRKYSESVKQSMTEAESRITALISSATGELDGKLSGYSLRAENAIENAASRAKAELKNEWQPTLERLSRVNQEITKALQDMQTLKTEIESVAQSSAKEAAQEVKQICGETLAAYSAMKNLQGEFESYRDEARTAASKAGHEANSTMELKVNEELEVLKSLRVKMEQDYAMLNGRINDRWDILLRHIGNRKRR